MTDQLPNLPTFFLERVRYDEAGLVAQLFVAQALAAEVTFEMPRAFRFFAESDYWHYLTGFNGRVLLASPGDKGCWIRCSDDTPYLSDYRQHVRAGEPEETFACLIATPDQCLEVICFEDPLIRII